MGLDDLHWRSIAETADLLRDGAVTSMALTEAVLERIDETEPALHAYVGVMAESARREAEAADALFARGESRSALQGIPVGVKDLCETAGFPTSAGSRALEGYVPTRDAVVVRRLRDAGAVIVGKTVTHEFAYGQDTPPTRNAWDQRCYPGGSSAGSGVAVAAGTAYGAVGTDTGGSIRVPAAVNGVVGIKPTFGRVSRTGVFPMSPTLDTVGCLTRTARDAALMLGVMAGRLDRSDRGAIDEPVDDYAGELDPDLTGVRIGVERAYYFYDAVVPDVRAAIERAIGQLEELGATIVEVEIDDLDLAVPAGMAVLLGDTSEWHQGLLRARGADYVRETRGMIEVGELVLATAYVRGQKARRVIQDRVRSTFEANSLDAIVAPAIPETTMPLDELSVNMTGKTVSGALSGFIHHNFLANVIGIPSVSIPAGFDSDELPIGMQVLGRPFDEATILRIGDAYQSITDWHARHPLQFEVAR
jgi:aspartyl-tRNA(Asn)/glutamyl-tRNA(Gln) amidotransferase subunit A